MARRQNAGNRGPVTQAMLLLINSAPISENRFTGNLAKMPPVPLIEVPQCSCGKEWTTIHSLTCLGSPSGTMLVEDDEMPERTLSQVVNEKLEQESMAGRTLSQVVNELEQVRGKVTSLEGQIQAQKQKALELSEELAGMVSSTVGHFGMTMSLTSKTDGLPATTSYRRSRSDAGKPRAPKVAENGAKEAEVKEWLVAEGHRKDKRGTVSDEQMKLYNDAHPV